MIRRRRRRRGEGWGEIGEGGGEEGEGGEGGEGGEKETKKQEQKENEHKEEKEENEKTRRRRKRRRRRMKRRRRQYQIVRLFYRIYCNINIVSHWGQLSKNLIILTPNLKATITSYRSGNKWPVYTVSIASPYCIGGYISSNIPIHSRLHSRFQNVNLCTQYVFIRFIMRNNESIIHTSLYTIISLQHHLFM